MTLHKLSRAAFGLSAVVLVGIPATAQAPDLAMLDSLERGSWDVRLRSGGENQRLCVQTGREFIQLRHNQSGCDRFVVQDEQDEVVVQYRCSGSGYGRTTIRREGRGLVQIKSTGFHGGRRFSIDAEARHAGRC